MATVKEDIIKCVEKALADKELYADIYDEIDNETYVTIEHCESPWPDWTLFMDFHTDDKPMEIQLWSPSDMHIDFTKEFEQELTGMMYKYVDDLFDAVRKDKEDIQEEEDAQPHDTWYGKYGI